MLVDAKVRPILMGTFKQHINRAKWNEYAAFYQIIGQAAVKKEMEQLRFRGYSVLV